MLILFVLLALSLSACNTPVQMRHTVTGKVVTCGPYNAFGVAAQATAVERERGCIYDYQRQGYERVN